MISHLVSTEEPLEVTFSYQYRMEEKGSGHRGKVEVKKGSTIEEFLEAVRKHLKGCGHLLR